jgi:hypothetical protein
MEVYHALINAFLAAVDFYILLALLPRQSVQAQEEAIAGLHYMFFGRVPE